MLAVIPRVQTSESVLRMPPQISEQCIRREIACIIGSIRNSLCHVVFAYAQP